MLRRACLFAIVIPFLLGPVLQAASPGGGSLLDGAFLVRLAAVPDGARVTVDDLPWERGNAPAAAVLWRRDVFEPSSRVHLMTDHGEVLLEPHRLPVFVGTVAGDPGTAVVMTLPANGEARVLAIGRGGVQEYRRAPDSGRWEAAPKAAPPGGGTFHCRTDELGPVPVLDFTGNAFLEGKAAGRVTTYRARVAVETDYEYYQLFNDTTAATDYIGTVIAASSAIYERDLSVQLAVGDVFLWQTANDPWSATDAVGVLGEFGDYWHDNRTGVVRDVAQFFSGKNLGGGVSWVAQLCSGDFYASNYGFWGGAYSVCGNIDGTYDPSSTDPWVRWDLICSAHELGHTFSSPHTHCYNDWPNAGDPVVDECYNQEDGCYSGQTSLPPDGGTIMSYCHTLSGGLANINLYFGLAGHYGTQSERVPQRMRGFVESIVDPPSCLEEVQTGPIPGDANADDVVNGDDLALIAQEIFDLDGIDAADMCDVDPPCPAAEADADGNTRIEAADLAVAIQNA